MVFTGRILTEIDHPVIISDARTSIAVDTKEAGMPQALDPVTQHHLDQAAERLVDEFAGIFSQATIARYMAESQDLLGEARINVFVPVLAHRFARERLRALAQAEGTLAKEQPEVLFVCVQNAGRSQMAAGLVKLRSKGRIHVRSAGSAPGEEIEPAVVEAMAELGVDTSEEFPKPLTDEVVRAADVVVTMGCGDACPIYPGKHYEDWELDDPAGQDLETVRRIRSEIDRRVQQLIGELLLESAGPGS
jgi:arsenate reductase (thioredoxin)